MKKIVAMVLALAALSSMNIFAAKKGKEAKIKIEVVNRPGMPLGTEVPSWVVSVLEGDNKKVAKALKLEDKQIFVFSNQNTDLEFLKTWTDQVDVQRQVANSFSMAVGQSANAVFQGTSGDETKKKMAIDQTVKALSAIEMNGLLKEASYWMQFRRPKQGIKVKKNSPDSAYDYYYEYYVVFAMDKKIYDAQLTAALNGIEDNASETVLLKKALSENLRAPLMDKSADSSVEYEFDD